jgi:6-pyruvoyltetrahydropterin/6-carboxytetrahydropterin synthase
MTLIRITKQFRFEMAHALKGHNGPCRHIHGHSYVLYVTLIGTPITDTTSPELGMIIDFGKLKSIVNETIINEFDHAMALSKEYASEIFRHGDEMFHKLILLDYQPTCENLLADFASRIRSRLPGQARLHSMKLWETATAYAEWFASDNS